MKKIILFLSILLSGSRISAITENEKLASLCQVWGLLKYHHPVIAKGKHNWDAEFMAHVQPVLQTNSREELSALYLHWIADLGKVKYRPCTKPLPSGAVTYLDNSWMDNKTLFTDSLSGLLHSIQHNRQRRKNYYAHRVFFGTGLLKLEHEEPYKDSIYPSAQMRMLCLSRYWNTINYFFPYKNIMDRNWDTVLYQMAPLFMHAADTSAYHVAIRRLAASINDSHAGFSTPYVSKYFGNRIAAFSYSIIDGKAIVTGSYNDSLTKADDIRHGDIITHVDGRPVSDILAVYKPYTCASNDAAMLIRAGFGIIFAGHTDQCTLTLDRNGVTTEKAVHRYPFAMFGSKPKTDSLPQWKLIDSSIGYVDMGRLTEKNIKQAMSDLQNTKAIIFDVRNYPKGTIYRLCPYLTPARTPFVDFTVQARRHPGSFTKFAKPQKTGRPQKNMYKGRTIFLFNGYTQSHAEYTCMAFKTVPNAVAVGSQTSGADGNVIPIILPGGYKTIFTGLGTFYPDGTPTQRVGIVPDINVTPTLAGIRAHKDEVLDRAIELVRTGK